MLSLSLSRVSISLNFSSERELYNFPCPSVSPSHVCFTKCPLPLFSLWAFSQLEREKKEIPLWKFLSVVRPSPGTKQMDDNNGLIWVFRSPRGSLRLLPI